MDAGDVRYVMDLVRQELDRRDAERSRRIEEAINSVRVEDYHGRAWDDYINALLSKLSKTIAENA
jgi:hypothetical protein